ncbi:MAG TPA: hypothetical protein VEO74_06125 [Thermoanaerobaculia bacterium]|nr:hypothetical protein [Thermoanaerobaculia bacterium]
MAFAGTRGPFDEVFNQIWIARPPSLEPTQLDPRPCGADFSPRPLQSVPAG